MQTTTAAFDDAIDRPSVTLVGARVRTDWAQNGYDGDDTIDDLTGQAGQPIRVLQSLDDGMPDELSNTTGVGVSEVGIPMDYGQRGLTAGISPQQFTTQVNGASTATFLLIDVPTCHVGDLMIMAVSVVDGTVTINQPNSWNIAVGPTIDDGGANGVNTIVFWRRAEAIDTITTAVYLVSFSGATQYSAICISLPSASFYIGETSGIKESGAGVTNHTTSAVMTVSRRAALVTIWAQGQTTTGTWTPDAQDTEIADVRGTHATSNINLMMAISGELPPDTYTRTAATNVGTDYATMSAVVIESRDGTGMNASQYFSPFNVDSPIHGFERDVAPLTIDQGVLTTNGPEYVRIFTGQMVNTPVRGRTAEVTGISAARMALSIPVQPPAIMGNDEGCNATWPVVYTLHKAGLYASPPPRADDCQLWMPMAGSMHAMMPDENNSNQFRSMLNQSAQLIPYPAFVVGPYLLGVDAACDAGNVRVAYGANMHLQVGGAYLLSQAGSTGRFEFWVRGDTCDLVGSPRDIVDPISPNTIVDFRLHNGTTFNDGWVRVGIDATRHVFVTVDDGDGHTATLTSTGTLSTDGAWYFCGGAWSFSGQKLWVNLDGTIESVVAGTLTTVGLPTTDDFPYDDVLGTQDPSLWSHIPIAEIQLTSGTEANPDTSVAWLDTVVWTQTAEVVPSQLDLIALAVTVPREAWALIGELAQGELAAIGTSELDLFRYLPQSYWARDAQQISVNTLSTTINVSDLNITLDYTRIKNSCTVSYNFSEITDQPFIAASLVETFTLTPFAIITIEIPAGLPIVWVQQANATGIDDSAADAPEFFSYFTANDDPDALGNFAVSGEVSVFLISWTPGSVTIQVFNNTATTWYFKNTKGWAVIGISGFQLKQTAASTTIADSISILARGERAITLDLPIIQRTSDAARAAQYVVDHFGKPLARVESAEVFGDPRRQPGDLITFDDAENTAADGLWRKMTIEHTKVEGGYTQRVSLVKAYVTGSWVSDAETDPDVLALAGVWDGDTVWADNV